MCFNFIKGLKTKLKNLVTVLVTVVVTGPKKGDGVWRRLSTALSLILTFFAGAFFYLGIAKELAPAPDVPELVLRIDAECQRALMAETLPSGFCRQMAWDAADVIHSADCIVCLAAQAGDYVKD